LAFSSFVEFAMFDGWYDFSGQSSVLHPLDSSSRNEAIAELSRAVISMEQDLLAGFD